MSRHNTHVFFLSFLDGFSLQSKTVFLLSVLLRFAVLSVQFSPWPRGALRENMCEPNVPLVYEEQDAKSARCCRHRDVSDMRRQNRDNKLTGNIFNHDRSACWLLFFINFSFVSGTQNLSDSLTSVFSFRKYHRNVIKNWAQYDIIWKMSSRSQTFLTKLF